MKMKKDNKKSNRINEQIFAKEVRIVDEGVSEVMKTFEALEKAKEQGLDLIEISPNAQPPVCKIMDYGKYLYQQKKREKEIQKKQVKVEVKEIRFTPQTDDHDFEFKLKHAKEFLSKGNKLKLSVFFKGRSIIYTDQGKVLLLKFASALEEVGTAEKMPIMEGKRMTMIISPKKKKEGDN